MAPCQQDAAITNQQELVAAKCTANPGTCAFCAYANGLSKTNLPSPPAYQPCGCTPSRLEDTKSYSSGDQSFWCFDNFRDSKDKLCIWKDFAVGRTNLAWQEPAAVQNNLEKMLTATADVQPSEGSEADHVCFHSPNHASVAWTHMHIFNAGSYAQGKGPDGVDIDVSYCTEITSNKKDMAAALSNQVGKL